MKGAIILFYLLSGAYTETKTYQHQVYMARKTRSNAPPIQAGYSYSEMSDGAEIISLFNPNMNGKSNQNMTSNKNRADKLIKYDIDTQNKTTIKVNSNNKTSENSPEIMKAKSKSISLPEEENKITSLMQAAPFTLNEFIMNNDRNNEYLADDDDLRKDSKMYDGWPYFHRTPYDYEHLKHDNEGEKAKDKRFIYDIIERVIPVQEEIKNDIPPPYYNPATESIGHREYQSDTKADNPMYGNQPFFSSVLTDYFDSNYEDDPLTFKGLNWGKDFDNERTILDVDENNKRVRRLQIDDATQKPQRNKYYNTKHKYDADENSAITEKGYNKYSNYEDQDIGLKLNENHKKRYKHNDDNYRGFKDFVDSFINKFGSEEHNKDIKHKVNRTEDKSKKKKGFRRVYHKDEYQGDNEFFDNSNNKSMLTENGGSKYNIGGSEAILGSHATAAIGNERKSLSQVGNKENRSNINKNENSHSSDEYNKDFNRYKDIAKMAAIQNNADYFDPF